MTIEIHPSAKISASAVVEAVTGYVGADVVIGDDSRISAEDLRLERGVQIGSRVTFSARTVFIGEASKIDDDCRFGALGKSADEISIGDRCFLGRANVVLVPRFIVGDYVAIHNHLLANGFASMVIGHNCWIGQNTVLNSNERLTIGNNVGIGAYSSVYTHAFNGELLEGCTIFNTAPVTIEDNVWIVGGYNVISPGVTLGRRSMVLTSSVVSKSVAPGHCVGGVPAIDLTNKITPFRDLTLTDKLEMMRGFVQEFVDEVHPSFRVLCVERLDEIVVDPDETAVVYACEGDRMDFPGVTVFDLSTKQYVKKRTPAEVQIIRFMTGYRARFVPSDRPVIM